ncbi:hypothetical protein pb186bvf_004139 [Paramecium bursaria]
MEDVINEHQSNNYESLIQKLEADIRQHIRIEQQQRLQIETLQQKIDEMQMEHEQEIKQLQTLIENKKFIAINKVQNLNQTNFIIDKGQTENTKKKSPTAFERLSILVKKHKQSKTTSTSEQMLALLKQLISAQQLRGKRLSTLRRENTTKGAFYTHRDDSSSIDKIRKTQSKLRNSQILQQDEDIKSSSFDADKKRYQKFQHLLKQK